MAVTEKDDGKTVRGLQEKLETSRAKINALRSDLNQARNLAADNSVEKLTAKLKEAHAQNTFLENEHVRLQTRLDELTAAAEKRKVEFRVLQLVINEAADKLMHHTEPSLRWWRKERRSPESSRQPGCVCMKHWQKQSRSRSNLTTCVRN